MTGPATRAEVEQAIAGVVESLRYDDYELSVVDVDTVLTLRITAGEGACEDCLAPPGVMSNVLSGALGGRYAADRIRIEYPVATSH